MVRIIGFHMPESCDKYRHFLQKKFNLNDKTKNGNYQPYSFQWRLYTRILIQVSTEVVLKCDNICDESIRMLVDQFELKYHFYIQGGSRKTRNVRRTR